MLYHESRLNAAMGLERLVDKTYQALLGVVHTTAVSKRVLIRPPFTFLHKLLVETLAEYSIFTYQQLSFAELVTKEDKAAFLVRAIAFVTFAMVHRKEKRTSCLLLVSPIKVLAGVAVEDTLEFLLQMCDVCKSTDRSAKLAAANDVVTKGDANLYTSGVMFRRGLLMIQAIVRAFIKRRAGKRKSLQSSVLPSGPVTMAIGTRFLKELADGRIYDGVIKDIKENRYILNYDQDAHAQDEVDEIEMKIIVEESQRLAVLRERIVTKSLSRSLSFAGVLEDTDISLTGLPDLSVSMNEVEPPPQKPKLVKRVTSRDVQLFATKSAGPGSLARSQSHNNFAISKPSELEKSEANLSRLQRIGSHEEAPESESPNSKIMSDPSESLPGPKGVKLLTRKSDGEGGTSSWQSSLKGLLAKGQQSPEQDQVDASPILQVSITKASSAKTNQQTESGGQKTIRTLTHTPNLPKLSIPGTKPLNASNSKRKLSTRSSSGSLHKSKSLQQIDQPSSLSQDSALVGLMPSNFLARPRPLSRSNTTVTMNGRNLASIDQRDKPFANIPDNAVDAAFAGTYQMTDQKTQEKLVLFREIVHRIDGYMKRKHLRVIDLFRFCDADGNGSISPQEMIDTLSQMEIQLNSEQALDFINYIDKDGNGSIDIDEFEELMRLARRNEAQREQLKKELHHSRRATLAEAKPVNKFNAFIKHKQRICDEFRANDVGGTISVSHIRSILLRLEIPGVDEALINTFIDRTITSESSSASAVSGVSTSSDVAAAHAKGSASPRPMSASASNGTIVHVRQLIRTLDDLVWTNKSNRFLDQSWLTQFDSQLERAVREYELL